MRDSRPSLLRFPLTACMLVSGALALMISNQPLQAQDHAGQYQQADIEYGSRLYGMHCINCHGENGDLLPAINLRSGQFPNAPTDRDLGNVIRDGISGTAMTPNAYSDSEITALVAFVRNITTVDLGSIDLGDPIRGQTLFEGKGDCAGCHRVQGRGPRVAPDLSTIGTIRTAATLERSILGTDGSMLPINRPVRVVLQDGTIINGRRLNEDTFTVQLVDDQERLRSLEKSALREYTILATPAMPSYAQAFNDEERADILAYLLSLKGLN